MKNIPKFENKELTLALCNFLESKLQKEEAEKQVRKAANEMSQKSQDFLQKLMSPYFDFSQEKLVPTGNNNFISYAKIEHNHNGLLISGNRCYFQGGKTVTGFHEEISVEDWLNLPEEIKNQNFEKLKNPGDIIKPTRIPFFYYNETDSIIENENFQLVMAKQRRISADLVPKQLFIISRNPEEKSPENAAKILKVCEDLDMPHNPLRLNSSSLHMESQILAEDFRLSNTLFKTHASFLVSIFGEDAVERACASLENTKEQKSKKATVKAPKPKNDFKNLDYSQFKM